jgi:primosomal protein N' (replication factor Y) (superfamily II helicase)
VGGVYRETVWIVTSFMIADILIPLALDRAYSYRVPAGMTLCKGERVRVPLGRREVEGIIWGIQENEGKERSSAASLKTILARIDAPPLPQNLCRFLDKVAAYTLAPLGSVLALALPVDPQPGEIGVMSLRLTGQIPSRLTPARERVLALLGEGKECTKSQVLEDAKVSAGVIAGLIDEGVLVTQCLPPPLPPVPNPDFIKVWLSPYQQQAAQTLREVVKSGGHGTILLEGVTGSGKTEVYAEALAQTFRQGRQALIMMPEIALTGPYRARFAARFGSEPDLWHSALSPRRRQRIYQGIASNTIKAVAGARSALFLPFADLGLIIVDEEHDGSYKQEEMVRYQGRDMAVLRGKIEDIPVILASATPSLESRMNAKTGRYRHLLLPERFAQRALPIMEAIDLRRHPPASERFLSLPLIEALKEGLEKGEQSLLFLNRRGYAPLTVCRACGHRHDCPKCSAWLVEHRKRKALICHHCGHTEPVPPFCPACGSVETLTPCGGGVERIAEETQALLPQARILVLSSDRAGGMEALRHDLETIIAGEHDILIGTQLVAKGHHFPHLTLAGILDADMGLGGEDPRMAERSFQLLQQVSGRTGRGEKPGRALIQTWQPDHPVIRALLAGDAQSFWQQEEHFREQAAMPPFGRLAALIISSKTAERALDYARVLALALHRFASNQSACARIPDTVRILGPAEPPLAFLRARHRQRILVKSPRLFDLSTFLRDALGSAPSSKGDVRVNIDIDPYTFV